MTMNGARHEPVRPHEHCDPERLTALFRALSDPTRLAILQHLAHTELRVGQLTELLGLAQSTVSAHLILLRDNGLVVSRSVGRATLYRNADAEIDRLLVEADHVLTRIGGRQTS